MDLHMYIHRNMHFAIFYLQQMQEFIYFYREQQQIFLFQTEYIQGLLKPIGVFAALTGQWSVQFFVLPYIGALVTAGLTLLAAIFIWLTMWKLNNQIFMHSAFAFLPALLYTLCLRDSYVHFDGLVALDLGVLFFWLLVGYGSGRWYGCSRVCRLRAYR